MRYFQEIIYRFSHHLLVFTSSLLLVLFGYHDLANERDQSFPKSEMKTKYEMEEIPMIRMDTSFSFDLISFEEEVKVMSTVVHSRDFMAEVFGKAASNNNIDSFLYENPSRNTTDLIIIDHLHQKSFSNTWLYQKIESINADYSFSVG